MTDNDGPDMDLSSGIAAFESKQFTTATRLLAPLAEQGDPDAQYRMAIMAQNGLGMVENQRLAFAYMKAAAEAGMGLAQHGLGFMYMQGLGTVLLDALPLHVHETQPVLRQPHARLRGGLHVPEGQRLILDHAQTVLRHDRHAVLGLRVTLLGQRRQQAGRRTEMFGSEQRYRCIRIQTFQYGDPPAGAVGRAG